MSDILRVRFSAMMNEDAKRAVEKFALHLRTVLENYHSLWEDYMQLSDKYDKLKLSTNDENKEQHSEEYLDSNGVCKKITTNSSVDPINICLKNSIKENVSSSLQDEENNSSYEHMSHISMSDLESDTECNMSMHSKALAKELQVAMLTKSPIISKRPKQTKRSKNALRSNRLNTLPKNSLSVAMNKDSAKHHSLKEISNQAPQKEIYRNEILTSSTCSKKRSIQNTGLGFTTSCNIDTSIHNSGKKVKQAKLVFLSPQKCTHIFDTPEQLHDGCDASIFPEPVESSKCSPHTENPFISNKLDFKDVIEGSPQVNANHSRLKSRLLKQKSSRPWQQSTEESDDKKENSCVSVLNTHSIQSLCETQKENSVCKTSKILSLKRACPKTNDVSRSTPPSPILVDLDGASPDTQVNSAQKSKDEGIVMSQSEPSTQNIISLPITDFTLADETFFEPEEERLKAERVKKLLVAEKKRNISTEQIAPSPKRIQLHNDNTLHLSKQNSPKCVYKTETIRNKAERAKMNGWSCWECKEYYSDLGLSEKELEKRKKQCSRHKAHFDEWKSTPDGFWNPVFPDTVATSSEDD